jgi:TetR/AcrR family transcriptional regulator, mexJK operon transcriptional repressor
MPAPASGRAKAARTTEAEKAANGDGIRPRKAGELDAARRARMLSTAVEIFFADGYHASMDSIASQAKVAKQTVYNHFGCKERLFAEVVQHLADTVVVPLAEPGLDVRTALIKFSLALRARVLSVQGIGAHRALVAEAPRFPELAQLIYAKGHNAALETLSEFLHKRMTAGELQSGDSRFAAQMLLGMLIGHDRVRLLYGVKPERRQPSEARACARIVDCFLNAFGGRPDASSFVELPPAVLSHTKPAHRAR